MNSPIQLNLPPLDRSTVESFIDFLEVPIGQLEVTENLAGAAGGSTLGQVRKENQDRYLVARYSHIDSRRCFSTAVVADGVGSLSDSGIAASAAIAAFVASLVVQMDRQAAAGGPLVWQRALRDAIQQANSYVYDRLKESGASTLSAVVVPADHPPCAIHVGDSKIFGMAQEKGFKFALLSVDQTVGTELQSLGLPEAAAAGRDPRLDRSLAQYVGMPEPLQPQFLVIEGEWESILLATDGIASAKKVMSDEGWSLILRHAKSRADFVRKLLFFCNWLGGVDNSTMVVLSCSESLKADAPRRPSTALTAYCGSRSMELRSRVVAAATPLPKPAPTPTPEPATVTSERKRHRGGKFRRGGKTRSSDRKSDSTREKSAAKSSPSITFLPGLAKDENALRNP